MKRIGILTYHCVPNFGAQLQALSTVGYLRSHGYEPVMLNWYPKDLEEHYLRRAHKVQNECQYNFSQSEMPVSKKCQTLEELCAEIEKLQLDGLFLGSDALFDYIPEACRYNISLKKFKKVPIFVESNHGLPNPFWGSFNDHLKTPLPFVGFSISSQNMPYSKLNKEERAELKRLLLRFKGLTVRDEWTKKMVEDVSGRSDITVTPDPVFSFNQNTNYNITKEDICKKYNLPENYILISFLYPMLSDEYVNRIIRLIEEKTGAECVSFPMPDQLRRFNTKHTIELPLNPLDWYYIIKYSRGYIGERMHPIVVSLHNSIPFYCFDQYGTRKVIIPRLWSRFIPESSKIYDILQKAGLLSNMCFYSRIKDITPEMIAEKFLTFDMKKCSSFAESRQREYDKAMMYLISLL